MSSSAPQNAGAFPVGFRFGTATAAFQIEGATDEDGRGESIWDRFCAVPGAVRNGEDGTIACDFYHRHAADIELVRTLGATAFRFSIAWPRVLPRGRGAVNEAGLDFYDRLVDELLAAGIEPVPTLYHWDLPVVLEDEGGWPRRETAAAFSAYAGIVADRIGDRVTTWITHNEPWVAAWLGYGTGQHAPGRTSVADALAAGHHLLLSHGLATAAIRAVIPGARVGITLDLIPMVAASSRSEDIAAAREADGTRNRWFLDPIFHGYYPQDALTGFAPDAPPVQEGDMECIAAPLDFLGVNYYRRNVMARSPTGGQREVRQEASQHTEMDWEVHPDSLFDLLLRLRNEYAPPAIAITENGAAFPDARVHDGSVRDPEREAYLASHFEATRRAIAAGVPVDGFFVWSLLDNFEWARGYATRFGLVYVDYATLERIPKSSFGWYRDFIARERQTSANQGMQPRGSR